ncbi:hypothetical protein AVEN_166241-1 [Araneus ventricosus]|uniref:Transposase Tc1-like domain-containing protein n=1 Tax=Araneus ventricosus TaxID=182803 RepID=A0A4Y2FS22_ARAVE|nr:hypothetical protein AVEN_166241-1 [Araneus ventricosus]
MAAVTYIVTWERQSFGKTISYASIYQKVWLRILQSERRKPFPLSSNERRRVACAKSHLSWTPSQWAKVLRTDESIFEVSYGNIGRKVIIGRRLKQTIHPVTSAWFLKQAL